MSSSGSSISDDQEQNPRGMRAEFLAHVIRVGKTGGRKRGVECTTRTDAVGKTTKGTTQTIYRVACRHKPYAQLGNAMIRDNRLSFEARGVLAYILSHPSNWRFGQKWLLKQTGLGKNRSYRIINELRTHGYCQRHQERRADGTLGPFEYVFTDEPDVLEPQTGSSLSDPDLDPQDMVGVDGAAGAETHDAVSPLPGNREAAPLPGKPEAAEPEAVNREAAIRKKDPNIGSYEDPPLAPQPSAGGRRQATYLPDTWTLPEPDRAWALRHAPRLATRIDEEAEAFRDWHAGKRRCDWPARWRTWVREAVKREGRRGGQADQSAPAGFGHVPRYSGVRNTGEPLAAYRERMIREGKLHAHGGTA